MLFVFFFAMGAAMRVASFMVDFIGSLIIVSLVITSISYMATYKKTSKD